MYIVRTKIHIISGFLTEKDTLLLTRLGAFLSSLVYGMFNEKVKIYKI